MPPFVAVVAANAMFLEKKAFTSKKGEEKGKKGEKSDDEENDIKKADRVFYRGLLR